MMNPPGWGSFGELLKAFRTRAGLTQQQLADELEIHRNTIGTWERDEYLPESKALVLALARCLRLNDHEARHLLEASFTGLAPHWSVPYSRNPLFTGREEILIDLHRRLQTGHGIGVTPPYALQGLGGLGKTQIALEYAYRFALEYHAVCWIAAETAETIISSLVRFARLLRVITPLETDAQRSVAAIHHWMVNNDQWLLIWDNLEDLDLLPQYLPPAQHGAVLITTRHQALGALAQGTNVAPMSLDEGSLLLLRRAKVLEPDASPQQQQRVETRSLDEITAARELVIRFDGLPLALDQAGAYCDETGCGVQDYLRRYDQQRMALLGRRGSPEGDHPHSVTTTIDLAMEQVEQRLPAAADLLRVCAVLCADAIPDEIIVEGAAHLGPLLAPLAGDLTAFDQAIAALRSLSLVQRHPATQMLSLHRLVQTVVNAQMSESEHTECLRRVVAALNCVAPRATVEGWDALQQSERLLPHILEVVEALPDHAANQDFVEVLQKAATYLRRRAQYPLAEALYQRALRIAEEVLGGDQNLVAELLTGLGVLYREQGKYDQAESLYRRALTIWEQEVGPDHPSVAKILTNLANLYTEQREYVQAEPLLQRSAAIMEQSMGPDHVYMAISLHNLADCYAEQGNYEQAEPLYRRALAIYERTVGETHLVVSNTLDSLGQVATAQGNSREAEQLLQRALAIREQALGPEHPETALTLYDLAVVYQQQGRKDDARALAERALTIRTKALGAEHPKTQAAKTLCAQVQSDDQGGDMTQ
jgi:tetratricopeptide (TPR) repeat protein/DNA-binding XRE family transcriptional regulator